MKKKNRIIICGIMAFLVLAFAGVGVLYFLKNWSAEPVAESGNKANVEWYDDDATEFVLSTAQELYEFSKLTEFYDFSGKTVKLGADIVINEGNAENWAETSPENEWYPIVGFSGVFDGQGHSISGLYIKGTDGSTGMFTETGRQCVIKNFSLLNSYITSYSSGGTGSIIGHGTATVDTVYSNAIVHGTRLYIGGIIGLADGSGDVTITNCWFDGSVAPTTEHGYYAGGIIGVAKSMVTMEHCLNTGSVYGRRPSGGIYIGGLCGSFMNGQSYRITDCLNVGKVDSEKAKTYMGSVFGRLEGAADIYFTDTYTTIQSCTGGVGSVKTNSDTYGFCGAVQEESLIGTEAYRWTTLDFDKYWTLVEDGTPVLRTFADKQMDVPEGMTKAFNVDWYDKGAKESIIKTKEDLYGFYMLASGTTFEEIVIKLGADIVINKGNAASWGKKAPDNIWIPIKKFAGTFDGNGHTISGLYIKTGTKRAGFFQETTPTSVVKNLKVKNSYIESTNLSSGGDGYALVGTIAGTGRGVFDTIYSDAIMVCDGQGCGGIVGYAASSEVSQFKNCWFNGSITLTGDFGRCGGGIVGYAKTNMTMEHCLNTGSISTDVKKGAAYLGGFCGYMTAGGVYTISDCLTTGKIETPPTKTYYGAFCGRVNQKSILNLSNVYVTKESCKSIPGSITADCTQNGLILKVSEEDIKGYDGYQWTTLDFAKWWTVVEEGTPVLRSFASKKPSVANAERMVDISWYNAKNKQHTIDSVQDLYGFYLLSGIKNFAEETIVLGADITLNEGDAATWSTTAPENTWKPIQKFAGTFDGQGHTIRGIYIKTDTRKAGLFSETTQDAVVKNLRIKNSYMESVAGSTGEANAILGSVAGVGKGKFDTIYSDAILVADAAVCGGIAGQVISSEVSSFNNCWFAGSVTLNGENGRHGGGIVGIAKDNVNFKNCLNTGAITSTAPKGGSYIGGIVGYPTNGYEYTFTDCLNTGVITAKNKTYYGAIFGRLDKETKATVVDVYTKTGCAPSKESVKNATLTGTVVRVDGEDMLGELAITNLPGLSFSGKEIYWITVKGNTPILKSFESEKQEIDLPPEVGTKTNPYVIDSKEDLAQFYTDSLSTDFEGKYFRLDADIEWNADPKADGATAWNPIGMKADGTLAKYFKGNFDGNNHKISGLYINSASTAGIGFIGRTNTGATIKNLILDNCYIESTSTGNAFAGSVVGLVNGTTIIENVYSDATIVASGKYAGGLVGIIAAGKSLTMNDCWYDGEIDLGTKGTYGGGLVGGARGPLTATNCLNSGKITSDLDGKVYVGGLCGSLESTYTYTFTDCVNTGIIDCASNEQKAFGSLIGWFKTSGVEAQFTDAYYVTDECAFAIGMIVNAENPTGTEVTTGTIAVTREEIKGELALTKASGLSFVAANSDDIHWMSVTDGMPKPDVFKDIIANEHIYVVPPTLGSEANPYIIDSREDLLQFYTESLSTDFEGEYFRLDADIEWNADPKATNATVWNPIGMNADGTTAKEFKGNFDGNNHKISGLYINSASTKGIGFIGRTNTGATIKNLILDNCYIESTSTGNAFVGGVVGLVNGTTIIENVYSDATIVASGKYAGGLVGIVAAGKSMMMNDCWYDGEINLGTTGTYGGGLVGGTRGPLTATNCLNSGKITANLEAEVNVGGLCGSLENAYTSTFTDCLNTGIIGCTTGKQKAFGSLVGWFKSAGTEVEFTDTYYVTDECVIPVGMIIDVEATAGLGNPTGTTPVTREEIKGELALTKANGLSFTAANADDIHWMSVTDGMPKPDYFVDIQANVHVKDTPQTPVDPEGSATNPYIIDSYEDFVAFCDAARAETLSGKHYKLETDIEWQEASWTPIPDFAGSLDGNGHTISGIHVAATSNYAGMFVKVTGATIKNLRVEDSTFTSSAHYIGCIAGQGYGTFEKIQIASNVTVTTTNNKSGVAGIIGCANGGESSFIQCWNAANITAANKYVGGLIGRTDKKVTIVNCLNTGTITAGAEQAGGFIGWYYTTEECKIQNSVNTGTISAPSKKGALVGNIGANKDDLTAEHCYNTSSSLTNAVAGDGADLLKYANSATEDYIHVSDLATETFANLDSSVWTIESGKVPYLTCFEWNVFTDGSASKPYILDSVDDLYAFNAVAATTDYKAKNYRLGADITLNGVAGTSNWTPIADFAGCLDGKGYTISGIHVVATANYAGMFTKVTGATIRNLRMADSEFNNSANYIGSIAGQGYGTFEQIQIASTVTVTVTSSNKSGAAGFIGLANSGESSFAQCWNAGTITAGKSYVGGFIGKADKKVTIVNCLNTGVISGGTNDIGGFIGWYNASEGSKIQNCVNTGTVTAGGSNEGAFVGNIGSGKDTLTLDYSYNTSTLADAVGGRASLLQYQHGAESDYIHVTDLTAETFEHLESSIWKIVIGSVPTLKCFE